MLTSMLVEIKHMKKKFCDQICAKMDQNQAVFFFFFLAIFSSLVHYFSFILYRMIPCNNA